MDMADEDFLPITSVEIDITDNTKHWPYAPTYHLNFFSKDPYADKFIDVERIYDVDVINDMIRRANERGFLAQYNHPRWSFQTASDFLPLKGLFGFEMFNTGCEVEMFDGYGDYEYETYVMNGNSCACVATDDNHNAHDLNSPLADSFKGFTMIKAPELTYDNILTAMENKELYASTGPLIHELYVEDDNVIIKTSPCAGIVLRTDSRFTRVVRAHEDSITSHSFRLDLAYNYIRFECVDSNGRKAMTRAYFRDEIE